MIRFPKQHIASSVVNRIMNVADELETDVLVRTSAPPMTTDPALQSAKLDIALDQPVAPTPPIEDAPDPGASVAGKPLLATMLDPKP
jgi:hypothetical protein